MTQWKRQPPIPLITPLQSTGFPTVISHSLGWSKRQNSQVFLWWNKKGNRLGQWAGDALSCTLHPIHTNNHHDSQFQNGQSHLMGIHNSVLYRPRGFAPWNVRHWASVTHKVSPKSGIFLAIWNTARHLQVKWRCLLIKYPATRFHGRTIYSLYNLAASRPGHFTPGNPLEKKVIGTRSGPGIVKVGKNAFSGHIVSAITWFSCRVSAILSYTGSKLCWDSLVSIKTCYRWMIRGSNPGGSQIFRTNPNRPRGPPNLLYNGYWLLPGGKAAGAWR